MRTGRGLIVFLIVIFAATSAMAGGFRLPEAGAKAMGMGFAFTAQADDPSAIYFNPAGIMQLEGINMMTGFTYVDGKGGSFSGTTPLTFNGVGYDSRPETQKDLIFIIPNTYFTHRVSPKFAYGIGIFSPFGLGQTYQESPLSIFRNQIKKIDLLTVVVNPTVAYKVNEYLSIGGGINYMYGKAKLSKTGVVNNYLGAPGTYNPLDVFQLDLEGDGSAWAFNLGVLFTPSKEWKVGLSYRSPFALSIHEGDVKINGIESTTPLAFAGGATAGQVFSGGPTPVSSFNTKGSTTVNLPATAGLGVSYTKNKLTIEVDADFTWWESYRSLDFVFKDNRALLPNTVTPKNWNDTIAFYIGGEYRVTDPLSLRLGFRYDPTPVPPSTMGPELPDAIKFYYSAGAGYKYNNWKFDFAYMYVDKRDRTVNNQTVLTPVPGSLGAGFNGKWSGSAHLVAFDIGYKF